ncbi:class I SAM-dependent methyltransferase [Bradyrhizobium tunisiense]|uniref:class I SAM-dependent methyltransferase n=1 Tax=Bradyrhizobium tunisiense TaxID=3278709 RepID=UPI0035DA9523
MSTSEANSAAFTAVAAAYQHRYGHNERLMEQVATLVRDSAPDCSVADIGAGTGTLTAILDRLGFKGWAIEPNSAMRDIGKGRKDINQFTWIQATAENTDLSDSSVGWVTMADAFHWTEPEPSLREFRRILKPRGYFAAIWSLRDFQHDPLQRSIDALIRSAVPGIKRVYERIGEVMASMPSSFATAQGFSEPTHLQAWHRETTSKQKYMDMWQMSHDIRDQVSLEKWEEICQAIEQEISPLPVLNLGYTTHIWLFRSIQ